MTIDTCHPTKCTQREAQRPLADHDQAVQRQKDADASFSGPLGARFGQVARNAHTAAWSLWLAPFANRTACGMRGHVQGYGAQRTPRLSAGNRGDKSCTSPHPGPLSAPAHVGTACAHSAYIGRLISTYRSLAVSGTEQLVGGSSSARSTEPFVFVSSASSRAGRGM